MKFFTDDSGKILSIFYGEVEADGAFDLPEIPQEVFEHYGNYKYINEEFVLQPKPEIDPSIIAEAKDRKIAEIKKWCGEAIVSGFDVTLPDKGEKHYTLTQTQQADMQTAYTALMNGATSVLWRDSERVMKEGYTPEQFFMVYNFSMQHIQKCKLHSDGLEQWVIDLAQDYEANMYMIQAIAWEFELPEELQSEIAKQEGMQAQVSNLQTFKIS